MGSELSLRLLNNGSISFNDRPVLGIHLDKLMSFTKLPIPIVKAR